MALLNRSYPPFLGVNATLQGYDSAIDGAPLYHCVFLVDETMDAQNLIKAVFKYMQDTYPGTPSMCLAFRGRGTVCTRDFETSYDMMREIELVKALPNRDEHLDVQTLVHVRSFMGQAAKRPRGITESIVFYNIDPYLSGRQIAEEAVQHFEHLRDVHHVEKLVLRFPNSGTVMVHRYMETFSTVIKLSTAIQRARKMKLLDEFSMVLT